MAFFYNLFVTISFVVCALLFLLVFQRHGYRVHLWVGVMFVLFTFDNLLLYMDELMPGFAVLAHSNYWAFLVASNVSGLAITFAYERIVRYQRSEGPHPVSWPFWAVLAVTYVVLGLFGESRLWARVAILALRGALPVVLILIAMRPQPGDLANPPIGRLAVWVLLAFQLLNTIEMVLVFMGVQLMPGRYVTIEAMSIASVVWGVWYCLRRLDEPAPAPAPGAELPAAEPMPAPGGPVDPVAAVCGKFDLTSREREILGLLYDGCTNQEIAERLFISEGTVKTHAHNIFRKTGCANRVQLLRLVADARER